MREIFLDTANLEDIERLISTDAVQGVTTNPSLMAKEGKGDYIKCLEQVAAVIGKSAPGKKHLSIEVIADDPKQIEREAAEIRRALGTYLRIELYVKVPISLENLEVITHLKESHVRVNATACMTALQAKLAEDAGADVVSFFYNRMKDHYLKQPGDCWNDEDHANQMAHGEIFLFSEHLRRNSRIICGSIRKASDVVECWGAGADIVTVSPKILREMVSHPKTDEAIAQFKKDIDAWLS